jgi:hypothetical protein
VSHSIFLTHRELILVPYEYSLAMLDNIHMTTSKNRRHVSCSNDVSSVTFPTRKDHFHFDISSIAMSLMPFDASFYLTFHHSNTGTSCRLIRCPKVNTKGFDRFQCCLLISWWCLAQLSVLCIYIPPIRLAQSISVRISVTRTTKSCSTFVSS